MGLLSGERIAGCVLLEHLGKGGIGSVYKARHTASGRLVAIKIIHAEMVSRHGFLQRFQREARLSFQIEHPHVVRTHTWGEEDGLHFFIMDFIDGPSLYRLIHEQGTVYWPRAVDAARQIAKALAHLHGLGLVHRDIKPDNILLASGGRAFLADLGLVRQLLESCDEIDGRRLTDEGTVMGSPCYMAPEQIRDTSRAGAAADIYGLGATLFHALTGRPPLVGDDAHQTLRIALEVTPRRASAYMGSIPPAVTDLLERCLAKDPAARPADAAALAAELAAVMRGGGESAATAAGAGD